jgi:hypothetical protein
MTRETCIQQLQQTYETNPALHDNISQLMNRARGSTKTACLELFDYSISQVTELVE